jgi:excisionase family DNA binding protein
MDPTSVNPPLPPMLTADEASTMLRVRKPQLYALAREGIVPAVRVGRAIRFNRDQLQAWIENGGAPHPGRAM